MELELAVTSATSKRRVIAALTAAGHRTGSGHVRLAYPFTVTVEGLAAEDVDEVVALARAIDPASGRILAPARSTAVAHR